MPNYEFHITLPENEAALYSDSVSHFKLLRFQNLGVPGGKIETEFVFHDTAPERDGAWEAAA